MFIHTESRTWHIIVIRVKLKSNFVDDNARLSKNEVGSVRIIPIRQMTFNRGLEALMILSKLTTSCNSSLYVCGKT